MPVYNVDLKCYVIFILWQTSEEMMLLLAISRVYHILFNFDRHLIWLL